MVLLELVCLAIVALYVVVRAIRDPHPARVLRRLALLAAAGFIGEESMILAHGFYAYSPGWSVFLDRVPLMIVLIWPVVIHSAWDLSRCLVGEEAPVARAALAGLFVLADASLIEPIAVRAGLWHWTEPGLFGVPPIGVLGWAVFAALAVLVVERSRGRPLAEALMLVVPVALTHAVLVALWWILFRWINDILPPWPLVVAAWTLSALALSVVVARRLARRVPVGDMLLRVPAAGFFFVLLGLHAATDPALIAWTLAFAPPYLALTRWRALFGRAAGPPKSHGKTTVAEARPGP